MFGVASSLLYGVMAVYALHAWGLQRLPSDVRGSRLESLPFIFPVVSALPLVVMVGVSALLDGTAWTRVVLVFMSGHYAALHPRFLALRPVSRSQS